MAEPVRDNLLDHEYDGIQEFDNPTPGWWHLIFLVSFVFSLAYLAFWHGSPLAWSIEEAHASAELRALKKQFGELGDLTADEETVRRMMGEARWMAVGQSVFRANCVSCHGASGEGLVGPNLTDDHWKNVARLGDILRVVSDGAANGAMPSWKNRLHPNEVILVSAYVAAMRSSPVSGPRGQEGDAIPAW